jgi:hypothetical protein
MEFEALSGVAILLLIQFGWIFFAYLLFCKKAKKGFLLLCLLTLLLVYNSYRHNLDELFSVNGTFYSFNEVYNKSQWPLRLDLITVDNIEYIEAVVSPGKLASLVRLTTFRSGMPAYVFDIKGRLIDSTIDHYDEARYQDKWERPDVRQSVSKADVIAKISRGE